MTNSSLVPGLHQVTALMIQPKKLERCNAALDEGSLARRGFLLHPNGKKLGSLMWLGISQIFPMMYWIFCPGCCGQVCVCWDIRDSLMKDDLTRNRQMMWPVYSPWVNHHTDCVKWTGMNDGEMGLTLSFNYIHVFFVYIQATLHGGCFAAVFRSHKLYYGTSESTMVYTLHHLWDEHVRKSWSIQIVIEYC